MSRFRLTDKTDERMAQSRVMLRQAMDMAFGAYIEQEHGKYDRWRRQSFEELARHAWKESEELMGSSTSTSRLHNAMDLCFLGAIMVTKIMLKEKLAHTS